MRTFVCNPECLVVTVWLLGICLCVCVSVCCVRDWMLVQSPSPSLPIPLPLLHQQTCSKNARAIFVGRLAGQCAPPFLPRRDVQGPAETSPNAESERPVTVDGGGDGTVDRDPRYVSNHCGSCVSSYPPSSSPSHCSLLPKPASAVPDSTWPGTGSDLTRGWPEVQKMWNECLWESRKFQVDTFDRCECTLTRVRPEGLSHLCTAGGGGGGG